MIVELSKAKVTIKDALTWGDSEKIQATLMKGAKMKGTASDVGFDFDSSTLLEAKYVALECAVVKIEEDGKEHGFSREWMDNLSKADGDTLYNAVDKLSKKE